MLVQAPNPPKSAETSWMPMDFMMSAELALDSSAGHVQYVTTGFPFGMRSIIDCVLAMGMFRAPGMCPR